MKKKMALEILVMVLSIAAATAQTSDTALKPIKTGNEWRMPGDALKRSQNFADELKNHWGLMMRQQQKFSRHTSLIPNRLMR